MPTPLPFDSLPKQVAIPSLGCLMEKNTAFGDLLCAYMLPVGLVFIALTWVPISRLLQQVLIRLPGERAKAWRERVVVSPSEIMKMVVWSSALFFNALVQKGFLLFTCTRSPNDIPTVVVYPHLECPGNSNAPTGEWLEILPYAVVYCIIITGGFLGAVTYGVYRQSKSIMTLGKRGPWSFLSTDFRDAYVWWPAFRLFKDLLVNVGSAVFANLGSSDF